MARTKSHARYAIDCLRGAGGAVKVLAALIRSIDSDIHSARMGHVPRGFTRREWIDELMLDRAMTARRLELHLHRLKCTRRRQLKILMHMR